MYRYKESEFHRIVQPLLANSNFKDTKKIIHHGITRYEHSMRVAYYSYKITKMLGLDYKETTEAALLHDFFLDEVKDKNQVAKLRQHPTYALENAKKYFDLSEKQEDIILTHMFPITFTPPKYLESWIVDMVDDAAAIYERGMTVRQELSAAITFLFVVFINYLKIR